MRSIRIKISIKSSKYLLFEIESLGGALARPLTPAVRDGSELALLVWAPSFPQVLGLRLAKNDDLGDWVLVGLLAAKKTGSYANIIKCAFLSKGWAFQTLHTAVLWHLPWLSTLSSSLGGEYLGLLGPLFGRRFLFRTSLNRLSKK